MPTMVAMRRLPQMINSRRQQFVSSVIVTRAQYITIRFQASSFGWRAYFIDECKRVQGHILVTNESYYFELLTVDLTKKI